LSNSPVLTGTPTAPTPAGGDNSTNIATTAFVVGASSGADTLNVNTTVVVNPFSLNVLVNGLAPVGETKVNSQFVTNNTPCMSQYFMQNAASGTRAMGTVYQNNTGHPIYVVVDGFGTGNMTSIAVSGTTPNPTTQVAAGINSNTSGAHITINFFVLPGNFYKVTSAVAISIWTEWVLLNGTFSDSGEIHASRALGTIYQNNSTSAMFVAVQVSGASANSATAAVSDPVTPPVNQVDTVSQGSNTTATITSFFIVPPGHYYKVTAASGSLALWHEYTWGIPCIRSLDLSSNTVMNGSRSIAAVSQTINTGTTTAASVVPWVYINSSPTRVRWVQAITTNSSGLNYCFMSSGESYPLLLAYLNWQQSGAVARTVKVPVEPGRFYGGVDNAAGTLTINHWWEYQLG
jgi:hypothetical protein